MIGECVHGVQRLHFGDACHRYHRRRLLLSSFVIVFVVIVIVIIILVFARGLGNLIMQLFLGT